MFKKIFISVFFMLVFISLFFNTLFKKSIEFESSLLSKYLKKYNIKDNEYIILNNFEDENINYIINTSSDKNFIFNCFIDFNNINFNKLNKYHLNFFYLDTSLIDNDNLKNNYTYVFDLKKPSSLIKTIPDDLSVFNTSGFFDFHYKDYFYYFKLFEKTNNKLIFSSPLSIYLNKLNYKNLLKGKDGLNIIKHTTGSDDYIILNKDNYLKLNLNANLSSIKTINNETKLDLNNYKNIVFSKCVFDEKIINKDVLLVLGINSLKEKIFIPNLSVSLSFFIIFLFLVLGFFVNILKIYRRTMFCIINLIFFLILVLLYKYIDIQIPLLYSMSFSLFMYILGSYFLRKNKTLKNYKGNAFVLYCNFPKIDNLLLDQDKEIINVINSFWSLFAVFIKETDAKQIFTTGKGKIVIWPKKVFNNNLFIKKLIILKESYSKYLLNINKQYCEILKPSLVFDCGNIIIDNKSNSYYGDIINTLFNLAKLNNSYSCFMLISGNIYNYLDKNNIFYPLAKDLFAFNWDSPKIDLNLHNEFFEKFKNTFTLEDLKEYAKIIKEDKNICFKVLLKNLYIDLKEGKNKL